MSLPQNTINMLKLYLNLFFMAIDQDKELTNYLKRKIRICEQNLANNTIDELSFENLINELITELDEHMFVWKIVAKVRASQFMKRGASYAMLVTAPDLKTCLQDMVQHKQLLLPESYSIRFYTQDDKVIYEVIDKGFESPLPHIKYDTAIGFGLFVFRETVGTEFDYDEIFVPVDRFHFDESIVNQSTKAKIIRDEGPMRATFSKKWFSKKNEFYDEELRTQVKKQLVNMIEEFKNSSSLTSEVTKIIKRSGKPAGLTQEKVAEQLGKSVSTFRRNLGEENTSYKILQNKVLDEICIDSLITSDIKIDALALKLGYSERSTFERAFRNKLGTTPAKFRELREKITGQSHTGELEPIINSLPPLPDSCQELIKRAGDSNLELEDVVKILNKDPIFAGRVMGLASKALYGTSPSSLSQAVGRNLGIETVKNLAVLYAAQDSLSEQIKDIDVDRLIVSTTITPRVFKILARNIKGLEFDYTIIEQCLLFGLLGSLVLFHAANSNSQKVISNFNTSNNFYDFLKKLNEQNKTSLFGTTALLLSFWGLNNEVIKTLTQLDKNIAENKALSNIEQLLLLTIAVCLALTFEQNAQDCLAEKADLVGIKNFENIWQSLCEST